MRILVITDDKKEGTELEKMLSVEEVSYDIVYFGDDNIRIMRDFSYDFVLVKLLMPAVDGYPVLHLLQQSSISAPVLILSNIDAVTQKLKSLGLTASRDFSDPAVKSSPLSVLSHSGSGSTLSCGALTMDLHTKVVEVGGKQIQLTAKEFHILEVLVGKQGHIVTKEELMRHIYNGVDEPEMKIIDVFVCKIRNKIEKASGDTRYIHTAWGQGYILKEALKEKAA